MRDTERARGRDIGRGRSRLHAGSLMWESIRELQDQALGQRQALNHWATQGSPCVTIFILFFKNILFVYSWETERERQRYRQREKQAPCREPDVGIDPGTPGSHPGPKAGAKPLSHPGIPMFKDLNGRNVVRFVDFEDYSGHKVMIVRDKIGSNKTRWAILVP